MNIYQLKSVIATYFEKGVDDLFVNDIDIGLTTLNQIRRSAEQSNDYEFTRKLLTLEVDGITGGSLDEAVEQGTDTTAKVKTLVDVGLFDTDGNFIPVEWTTIGDSLNRQRLNSPYMFRYPTDGQAVAGPIGQRRFQFVGNKIYYFPKTPNTTFTVGLEAYTISPDWTEADAEPDVAAAGEWLLQGDQFLQWASIIYINHMFRQFVFRQEGNLPPPEKLRDDALAAFQTMYIYRFEQFRRHSR